MAQTTTITAGSAFVRYEVTGTTTQISTLTSTGVYVAFSSGNTSSLSAAVSDAVSNLNREIQKYNRYITNDKEEISSINAKLSNPDLSEQQRGILRQDISDLNDEIASAQKKISASNDAIAQLNASGVTTLQGLVEKNESANKAAATAKPEKTEPLPPENPPPDPAIKKPTNNLTGPASDDSGVKQPNTAGTNGVPAKAPVGNAQGTGNVDPSTPKSGAGPTNIKTSDEGQPGPPASTSTNNGSINAGSQLPNTKYSFLSTQSPAASTGPGKRLYNPLGEYSSVNYQISLYVLTDDAYNAYINSGRTKINVLTSTDPIVQNNSQDGKLTGAFLIAQSGGINKSDIPRAPGFNFDLGIDNLEITQAVAGKSSGSAHLGSYEFSFTITEPYGFSFISNLKRARDALAVGRQTPNNTTRQLFVLGIRFLGYDSNGEIATTSSKTTVQGDNAPTLDPASAIVSPATFETFYDIIFTDVKFKIDGRAVTYHITAGNHGAAAGVGTKYGLLPATNLTINALTVADGIDQIMAALNKAEEDNVNAKKVALAHTYKVVYLGNEKIQPLIQAGMLNAADLQKFKWTGKEPSNSSQSNPQKELENSTPNNLAKKLTLNGNSPVIQDIDYIIRNSKFLYDALYTVYKSQYANPPELKSDAQVQNSDPNTLSWYSVTCQIQVKGWDTIRQDWAYDITYLIQPYNTYVVNSVYVNSGQFYPGPHKRYEYWFTGQNNNILNYEQTLDNAYFVTAATPTIGNSDSGSGNTETPAGQTPSKKNAGTGPTEVPKVVNQRTNQQRTGELNYGNEAQNSFLTALYDPVDYAKATITILGDPDFLISAPVWSENSIYDNFYGDGKFSVNPDGGQVFIEIDFKEAIDYELKQDLPNVPYPDTSEQGIMSINDRILFWKYPDNIAKIAKGIIYCVYEVKSMFRDGKFTQVLTCNIQDFGDDQIKKSQEAGSTVSSAAAQQVTANPNTPAPDGTTSPSTTPPIDPSTTSKTNPSANTPAPTTKNPAAQPDAKAEKKN